MFEKIVVVVNGLTIPEPVLVTLSLGTKFVYDSRFSKEVYNTYRSAIQNTQNVMPHVDYVCVIKMKQTLKQIKYDNMGRCVDTKKWVSHIKGYLRQCLYSTNMFFEQFDSVFVIDTDKGNSILSKSTYHSKITAHIKDGIENGTYTSINLLCKIL